MLKGSLNTVAASTGKDNVLSLAGGILYADLAFKKLSNDLVLTLGSGEHVRFQDLYANTSNHRVAKRQVLIEGTSDYNAVGTAIHNHIIQEFDVDVLASAFDAACAACASTTTPGAVRFPAEVQPVVAQSLLVYKANIKKRRPVRHHKDALPAGAAPEGLVLRTAAYCTLAFLISSSRYAATLRWVSCSEICCLTSSSGGSLVARTSSTRMMW